jgi:hypothetical protein
MRQGVTVADRFNMISTGSSNLDELLQWLRPGDNVVWQVEHDSDYIRFARLFAAQAAASGKKCIYIHFSPNEKVLLKSPGIIVHTIDPVPGFDYFSRTVTEVLENNRDTAYYVFDNLSSLVDSWATDELLAAFYQVTCPYVFEMGSIAYFAIYRDVHDYSTIARIKTTTQILINIYHSGNETYIHPLKVWQRYSPFMFFAHRLTAGKWVPLTASIDAAAVGTAAGKQLVNTLPDSDSPWNSVYKKLLNFRQSTTLSDDSGGEIDALKNELTRMMFGDDRRLSCLAEKYLTTDELVNIRGRLIGTGRIGGKSIGMLIARSILTQTQNDLDFSSILEMHDSFYIGSDVFFSFLVNNDLFRLRIELSRHSDFGPEEFSRVERTFLEGSFPRETLEQFRDMLEHFGQAPIIVRSSSLLEDGFTHAYAGKYRSEFCANQGTPEERLDNFLRAVKLVYASALNPDDLSYRKRMNLSEGDEQMAILVQRVSGMTFKNYFFPTLAGVAFSHNLYAWNKRIDANKGLLRIVFGLGTRAVNRTGKDYTRMVSISHPLLRPESQSSYLDYSQKYIDLIDISSNQFLTMPLSRVLNDCHYPNLRLLASSMAEGFEKELAHLEKWNRDCALTLSGLLGKTSFAQIMDAILTRLEEAWGQPVDIEFTAHVDDDSRITVNLLQCRSLRLPRLKDDGSLLPEGIQSDHIYIKSVVRSEPAT